MVVSREFQRRAYPPRAGAAAGRRRSGAQTALQGDRGCGELRRRHRHAETAARTGMKSWSSTANRRESSPITGTAAENLTENLEGDRPRKADLGIVVDPGCGSAGLRLGRRLDVCRGIYAGRRGGLYPFRKTGNTVSNPLLVASFKRCNANARRRIFCIGGRRSQCSRQDEGGRRGDRRRRQRRSHLPELHYGRDALVGAALF